MELRLPPNSFLSARDRPCVGARQHTRWPPPMVAAAAAQFPLFLSRRDSELAASESATLRLGQLRDIPPAAAAVQGHGHYLWFGCGCVEPEAVSLAVLLDWGGCPQGIGGPHWLRRARLAGQLFRVYRAAIATPRRLSTRYPRGRGPGPGSRHDHWHGSL